MKNSRMPTPGEVEELTAVLPKLYADDFQPVAAWGPRGTTSLSSPLYNNVVYEFFNLLGKESWSDYDYSPSEARDMLDSRDAVARATLEEVRTMLTLCRRGENFNSGWWDSMIARGRVRWLLERLIELNEKTR